MNNTVNTWFQMQEVEITKEPIELYKLLKLQNVVASGAEAKIAIAAGQVLLNGTVETQKRKKVVAGDIVEFANEKFQVCLQS